MLDVGQVDTGTALDYVYAETPQPELQQWIAQRVNGAWQNLQEIDTRVQKHLQNWSWERVGRVERSLLRLAVYEMLHCDDLTFSAAISEALDLAREYGDDKSVPFLNGVLDAVWRESQTMPPTEESEVNEAG